MTYQVCILDADDIYHVLYSDVDGVAAQTFYTARIAELFATTMPTTPNTFVMSIQCMNMDVSTMFPTQVANIQKMVANPVSYLMTVCF